MNLLQDIQSIVADELTNLNLQFTLQGLTLSPHDVAKGFIPVFFEQQQSLMALVGMPEEMQPKAFARVIHDETAFFERSLAFTSEKGKPHLVSYLTDAVRMLPKLAEGNHIQLDQMVNPDNDTPFFLSAVLDELCDPVFPKDIPEQLPNTEQRP